MKELETKYRISEWIEALKEYAKKDEKWQKY